MYAIIEESGTQIRVSAGDLLEIDRRDGEPGGTVTFDRVLAIGEGEGEAARLGTPYLDGATVTAELVEHVQSKKLHVLNYKRRKGQRTKKGHRQVMTRIKIAAING